MAPRARMAKTADSVAREARDKFLGKEVKRFEFKHRQKNHKEEVEKMKRWNVNLCTRFKKAKIMLISERQTAENFAEMLWTKSIDGKVPLK